MTSASLLARATRRPEASAARTAGRAVIPVVATTTISTPSAVASSSRPPSAHRLGARSAVSVPAGLQTRAPRELADLRVEGVVAVAGRPGRRTSYRSGAARTTSTVWRPMDPVLPRMAIPVMARDPHARRAASAPREQDRRRERASESIRSSIPPWPGNRLPGVLPVGGPLEHRLGQVTGLGDGRRDEPHHAADERAHVEQQPAEQRSDDPRGDCAPDVALDRLARAHEWMELPSTDGTTDRSTRPLSQLHTRPNRSEQPARPAAHPSWPSGESGRSAVGARWPTTAISGTSVPRYATAKTDPIQAEKPMRGSGLRRATWPRATTASGRGGHGQPEPTEAAQSHRQIAGPTSAWSGARTASASTSPATHRRHAAERRHPAAAQEIPRLATAPPRPHEQDADATATARGTRRRQDDGAEDQRGQDPGARASV